jgi:predicted transcriptional regulator
MVRKIRVIIKQAQAGNEATVNPTDYDPSFPTRLGMAAVINQAIDNVNINTQRTKNINPLQFLTTQKDNASTTLGKAWLENVRKNTKTGTLDFNLLSTWASSLGVDVNIVKINDLNTAIAGLSGDDKNQGIQQSAIPQLQKYVSEGKTSAQVKAVENQIINDPTFTIYIESIQTQQTVKFQSTGGRIIVSQAEMGVEQAPLMPEDPAAQAQDMSNPLT